jgi:hypothetical protein
MASSINALSYLNASLYQSPAPLASSSAGASATADVQALPKPGSFQNFLKDPMAAALLQPATGINSGAAATTLVNNMLQAVLGAYRTPDPASNRHGIDVLG